MGTKLIKELSCVLTEDERHLRGNELAAAMKGHYALELEKKNFNAEWKDRKTESDETIQRLTDAVTTGKELRDVECRQVPDWKDKMVIVFRIDTGERLFSRPMEANELQSGMFEDDDEQAEGSH